MLLLDITMTEPVPMGERGFYSDTPHLVVRNFFSAQECRNLVRKVKRHPTPVWWGDTSRKADLYFLQQGELVGDCYSVMRKVLAIFQLGMTLFGHRLEFVPCKGFQVSNYKAGDLYAMHVDSMRAGDYLRLLSLVVELSEPGAYTGGGIEICRYEGDERGELEHLPQGAAVLFPSNRPHRAIPVDAGERQSLAVWAVGRYTENREQRTIGPFASLPAAS